MFKTISLEDLSLATGGADFFTSDSLQQLQGGTNGTPVTSQAAPGRLICQAADDESARLNKQLTGGVNLNCTFFPSKG